MMDHSEAIGLAEGPDLVAKALVELPLFLPTMLSVFERSVYRRRTEEHVKQPARALVLGTW